MSIHSIQKAERAALFHITGYLLLAGIKILFAYLSGSFALCSYGVLTAAIGLRQLSMLLRLREETPRLKQISIQGSRKYFLLAVGVSALLLVAGIEFIITIFKQLHSIGAETMPAEALGWLAAAILLTEALRWYQSKSRAALFPQMNKMLSKERISSRMASLSVLIGIGGAWLGAQLGWKAMAYADAAGAALISLLVVRAGYLILLESRVRVMGEVLEPEDKADLIRNVQRVKGVIAVDGITLHEQGYFILVDIKISVNPSISVQDGQEIAKMVKHHLLKRFMHISDVLVSVQPYDGGYPYSRQDNRDSGQLPIVH
ncbi:cation diffusion facilitator family transporter [Paenibacillus senegalensis]|uniref:cation diffusion facilitator family transporter n=1 Tax=Paenibacillus senegalensis TaxID=1465766 RepID=UPI000289A0D1|nr:cation transporter dimerization domain-containing protein [Paenibacillus senegalensis]